jgi:hypothetical protein
MRRWCILLIVLTVLIWGLASPVLMASSPCAGMGAMCEGPCGASSCAVSAPAVAAIVELVSASYAEAATQAPAPDPAVLELPPK